MLTLDKSLAAFLQEYEWPGNVRQLKNCLESMVVLARDSHLTLDDLPRSLRQPGGFDRLAALPLAGHGLDELERHAIRQTLDQNDGNRTLAARILGVSVRTLQRKLKQWNGDANPAAAT